MQCNESKDRAGGISYHIDHNKAPLTLGSKSLPLASLLFGHWFHATRTRFLLLSLGRALERLELLPRSFRLGIGWRRIQHPGQKLQSLARARSNRPANMIRAAHKMILV